MVHYLYILNSKSIHRYYVGESPDVDHRLGQHNAHYFNKGFTKSAEDWKVVHTKACDSKEKAVYLERFIKRMKSKKFIEKVIAKPELLENLLRNK